MWEMEWYTALTFKVLQRTNLVMSLAGDGAKVGEDATMTGVVKDHSGPRAGWRATPSEHS